MYYIFVPTIKVSYTEIPFNGYIGIYVLLDFRF